MKKTSLFLIIILCLSTCKNESTNKQTNKDTSVNEESEVQVSVFEIELEVVVESDDVFEFFYRDYDDAKYSRKTKITKKVKGKPSVQKLKVQLPNKVFPTSIRIDFGKNKDQQEMAIRSVTMRYEDFVLEMNSVEFAAFFKPNNYIIYNKHEGTLICKEVNGKYDPYFDSKPLFKKKLKIEAR